MTYPRRARAARWPGINAIVHAWLAHDPPSAWPPPGCTAVTSAAVRQRGRGCPPAPGQTCAHARSRPCNRGATGTGARWARWGTARVGPSPASTAQQAQPSKYSPANTSPAAIKTSQQGGIRCRSDLQPRPGREAPAGRPSPSPRTGKTTTSGPMTCGPMTCGPMTTTRRRAWQARAGPEQAHRVKARPGQCRRGRSCRPRLRPGGECLQLRWSLSRLPRPGSERSLCSPFAGPGLRPCRPVSRRSRPLHSPAPAEEAPCPAAAPRNWSLVARSPR
jgi:hypothetical protein